MLQYMLQQTTNTNKRSKCRGTSGVHNKDNSTVGPAKINFCLATAYQTHQNYRRKNFTLLHLSSVQIKFPQYNVVLFRAKTTYHCVAAVSYYRQVKKFLDLMLFTV